MNLCYSIQTHTFTYTCTHLNRKKEKEIHSQRLKFIIYKRTTTTAFDNKTSIYTHWNRRQFHDWNELCAVAHTHTLTFYTYNLVPFGTNICNAHTHTHTNTVENTPSHHRLFTIANKLFTKIVSIQSFSFDFYSRLALKLSYFHNLQHHPHICTQLKLK